MEPQQPLWSQHYWDDDFDQSSLPLTHDAQTSIYDTHMSGDASQCLYCAWVGQICLCSPFISSWMDEEPWLHDVGPDTSELGDFEDPGSSQTPDWELMWPEKVSSDVLKHQIDLCSKGDLASATKGWSSEELEARCRIVRVQVSPAGRVITASFVDQEAEEVEVSCLWWREKRECFVTCADVTKLVEPLVLSSSRSKDVKARIRRAIAFYKPSVVSERRNREMYRLILSIGVPQALRTRKTFNVLPWRFMEQVLGKILGEHRAVDRRACS